MRIPIRIITTDFQLVAEIDNYESLLIESSWCGIGTCQLKINRHMKYANELIKGRIIFPGAEKDKPYIIKHREIEVNERGKISENWIIKAVSLKGLLAQRITMPPVDKAYDYVNANVETIMRGYVERNAISPTDSDRIIPNLAQSTNEGKGPQTIYQTRFKNLADELSELSLVSGLGWNVRLDTAAQRFIFDVLEGRDLTVNQNTLPPVIFSPKFNSLKQLSYTESELNYKNTAYVAGQGEGIERRVVEVGATSGINRHEIFVDARDIAEEVTPEDDGNSETPNDPVPRPEQDVINDLIARGNQNLAEYDQEEFMEGEVLQKSPFVYKEDYDLGDMVTTRNDDWGITMDARITVIRESYSASGKAVEVTFNESQPTLINVVKRSIKQSAIELRR
ncbi:siphovirus ReqiPepy6 Gp37-like family protein [Exiguobacterium profundum]|uniref:siphovirus ReqiPepy6 Gp37-like family protein n=1 Tax=Exiguobacterium profundum TaxID=307643 RepID=UPI0035142E98